MKPTPHSRSRRSAYSDTCSLGPAAGGVVPPGGQNGVTVCVPDPLWGVLHSAQHTGPVPQHPTPPSLGCGAISMHGTGGVWGSATGHFSRQRLFLKEREFVVILRHRVAQNVFERCHISSVISAELFTRRSPGLVNCGYLCGRRGLQRPPPIRSAGSRRMVP